MDQRVKRFKIGQSDILTSAIVMGTSQAGKDLWVGIEEKEIIKAIHSGIDAGVTSFDTAELYGDGLSEKLLGEALRGRRKEVTLLSKVSSSHLKYDLVLESCERSLKNLNTDYLDLYQIHWPSGSWNTDSVPLEETLSALTHLKEQGKIRVIGVSNFSLLQLQEACKLARIESVQPPYSLFWRSIEKEIVPFCQAHQISIFSYAPLSQGFLTGKFKLGHRFAPGDHRAGNKLFAPSVFPSVLNAIGSLEELAHSKRVSLSQLALAWVIHHSSTGAIVGVRNAQQILENAEAGTITLTEQEMEAIAAAAWPVARQFMDSTLIWNITV